MEYDYDQILWCVLEGKAQMQLLVNKSGNKYSIPFDEYRLY